MRLRMDDTHRDRLGAAGTKGCVMLAGALDHYLDFYARVALGDRSCAVHDVLAVGVAAELAAVGLGPTVKADVEDGDGPARGATIFDLRGMYRGHPPVADAHIRVVLETVGDFADDVVTTIVSKPAATDRS